MPNCLNRCRTKNWRKIRNANKEIMNGLVFKIFMLTNHKKKYFMVRKTVNYFMPWNEMSLRVISILNAFIYCTRTEINIWTLHKFFHEIFIFAIFFQNPMTNKNPAKITKCFYMLHVLLPVIDLYTKYKDIYFCFFFFPSLLSNVVSRISFCCVWRLLFIDDDVPIKDDWGTLYMGKNEVIWRRCALWNFPCDVIS